MSRGGRLSARICIEVDGDIVPYLEIDAGGTVKWLVSDEEQKKYEQAMLNNMGDCMSRFYTANPEYIK